MNGICFCRVKQINIKPKSREFYLAVEQFSTAIKENKRQTKLREIQFYKNQLNCFRPSLPFCPFRHEKSFNCNVHLERVSKNPKSKVWVKPRYLIIIESLGDVACNDRSTELLSSPQSMTDTMPIVSWIKDYYMTRYQPQFQKRKEMVSCLVRCKIRTNKLSSWK